MSYSLMLLKTEIKYMLMMSKVELEVDLTGLCESIICIACGYCTMTSQV